MPVSFNGETPGESTSFLRESIVGSFAPGADARKNPRRQSVIVQAFSRLESSDEIGFHDGFDLSTKNIMIKCIAGLLIFFVMGAIAYSYVFEHWTLIDSFYFMVTTFSTVGYGDLTTSSQISRIFTTFLALSGITGMGIFLGLIGSAFVNRERETMNLLQKSGADRVVNQFVSNLSNRGDEMADIEDVLEEVQQNKESIPSIIVGTVKVQFPSIVVILLIAIGIGKLEGWDYSTSIYYAVVTSTTTGFGDVDPSTQLTRFIAIFFIPLSVALMAEILGSIAGGIVEMDTRKQEEKFLERELTLSDIEAMDEDHDDKVSPEEFLTFMLVAMQKVDRETIDQIMDVFHKLDETGDGHLTKDDLKRKAGQVRASRFSQSYTEVI